MGKGKWVKDDPKKYAARDDWFTGGWPGGEVGLKEGFAREDGAAAGLGVRAGGKPEARLGGARGVRDARRDGAVAERVVFRFFVTLSQAERLERVHGGVLHGGGFRRLRRRSL